jgi:hypothetical protein
VALKKASKKAVPVQGGLLGNELACPDVAQLPLVSDDQGKLEVLAPGHLYQPLLLKSKTGDIDIQPGALDDNERRFVADLVKRLYPDGSAPRALGAPLKWGKRDIHLRRNLDKDPGSFRLRVDDSDWYYPDFILWIIDYQERIQTFGFVDPKGLYSQAPGGWGDHKVVSTTYMPHLIEQQLGVVGHKIDIGGEAWQFRIRGVLLSTSSWDQLQQQAKFKVSDSHGIDVAPSKDAMRRGRVIFQEDRDYIDKVLDLLVHDTEVDVLLSRAAVVFALDEEMPLRDHRDAYLRIEGYRQPESNGPFAERVLKDVLLCEDFVNLSGAATHRASADYLRLASDDPHLAKTVSEPSTLFRKLLQRLEAGGFDQRGPK